MPSRKSLRNTVAAISLLLAGGVSAADRLELISDIEQATLVELFTSEGCSSCPPADRWLSSLKEDGRLWNDVLPVAFHVDYWDYIGWRDRFAKSEFSDRQRRYALEGGSHSVYTPGMFQNGREWRGWWRGEAPQQGRDKPGRLAVTVDGNAVSVGFRAHDLPASGSLLVHVAILGMDLETTVTAGENDGRTLAHDFVVLGVRTEPLAKSGDRYATELRLPAPAVPAAKQAIVAWISRVDTQAPLQAVGGLLID